MSSLNKCILIGRCTAQPEMKYTKQGKAVTTFSLAVDRNKKTGSKDKETDFVQIVAWEKLAEICAQYLEKGKLVCIDGRLQVRDYETKEGQKRKVYEVVASDMRMLSGGAHKGESAKPPAKAHKEDDFDSIGIQDIGMEDDVPF